MATTRHTCSVTGTEMPRWYNAQWNDDIHHVLHVLVTGEIDGYYSDYITDPISRLGRCLTEGFAYQGEMSHYRSVRRGEPSGTLPPQAFVSFLQNHDQIGNRALGERLSQIADPAALKAATVILLLAPSVPLTSLWAKNLALRRPFFTSVISTANSPKL